jgi:hypothetical protein
VRRAAHRRRRNWKRHAPLITATLALVAVLIVAGIVLSSYLTTNATGPPTRSTTTVVGTTLPRSTSTTLPAVHSSQMVKALTLLIGTRSGRIEVAVDEVDQRVVLTAGRQLPQAEASVVKVNILAALLAMSSQTNTPLSAADKSLAESMIEESDNDSATALWNAAGGTSGISTFDSSLGLHGTTPSSCVVCAGFPWPGWGLTTTTPLDEVKLLRAIYFGGAGINAGSRSMILHLMESVIPSERWGVSAGVTDGASIALKNGWLPLNATSTDWQINSVGWVHGGGRNYLIALFSTGNPSEGYGIQTLNDLSQIVWSYSGH